MKKHLACLILLLSISLAKSNACSAFLLKGKDYCVIGFNENWKSMPGMVVVNPVGVDKYGLSWNQLVSDTLVAEPKTSWTSLHGSITFNLLGLDMPCYGINQGGLFIVELYLDKTFSVNEKNKPNLFWAQWIQYQLDNYATVDEVLANLNNAPTIDWWPKFPGSHFFVSDKSGDTCIIELIDGKYVVAHGEDMPQAILCNDQYKRELDILNTHTGFGGSEAYDLTRNEWGERYTKAGHLLKNYDQATTKQSPMEYSWDVLNNIMRGEWQLVYDVNNNNLEFRTDLGNEIKRIDFDEIDFNNPTPIYLDINSQLSGEVLSNFEPLTLSINRKYVAEGFPTGYDNADFPASREFEMLQQNISTYVVDVHKLK